MHLRIRHALLAAWIGVLVVLHQDFWNWDRVDPRAWGVLPIGLVYHGLYCLAASFTCWMLVRWAWPALPDDPGATPVENPAPLPPAAGSTGNPGGDR
jgi:hypothetical protein